ncbi:hypothetical protein DRE_07721 [Drechslerella stenobrocha 248]|uniref:Uncharacterized protein n=1 Tax=Drechslerella stenobrocha 248 TaxID=1043628 RepID=W7I8Y9_9PEZI|nr:hypothetical protein DRE_07721 [Drechslerella stenobrocha 248]
MPTPFKNALPTSSQQVNGDQILFPSEQPRLNSVTPQGSIVAQPNLTNEVFQSLSPADAVDNGLGLQGLHTPALGIAKPGADTDGSLTFHPYPGTLQSHMAYGVPGLEYNAAVLSPSYESTAANDISNNILAFYPSEDNSSKTESRVNALYGGGGGGGGGGESHIPPHTMLASSSTPGQANIKEEQVIGGASRRGSQTALAMHSSKAATISGFNLKTAPPPINTDTLSSGAKSQHGTWRRGNKACCSAGGSECGICTSNPVGQHN